MQPNFPICLVFSLNSWWHQTLGKTYGFQCKDGVMVSDSLAFRITKSCRQHALSAEFDVGDLSAFVTEWCWANLQ